MEFGVTNSYPINIYINAYVVYVGYYSFEYPIGITSSAARRGAWGGGRPPRGHRRRRRGARGGGGEGGRGWDTLGAGHPQKTIETFKILDETKSIRQEPEILNKSNNI